MGETLTIAPQNLTAKSRQFTVELLCMITADGFWTGGTKTAYRPIYLAYAASDQMAKAFTANLRTGRPADVRDAAGLKQPKPLEILRSAGMKWHTQQMSATGISVVTGRLPALCDRDPGLLPDDIRFLFAPPAWWVERELQHPKITALVESVRMDAVLGGYLASYIDTRTQFPLVPDPLFHARLYRTLVAEKAFVVPAGAAYTPGRVWSFPSLEAGPLFARIAVVHLTHAALQRHLQAVSRDYFSADAASWLRSLEEPPPVAALAAETQPTEIAINEPQHLEEASPDVPTRITSGSGLLPDPRRPDPQLSLFDFV